MLSSVSLNECQHVISDQRVYKSYTQLVPPTERQRILKMRQLLLFLAAASSASSVKQLPPKMSYCNGGETTTWWPAETTTAEPTWPATTTEEPTTWPATTTTEDYDTTTTSQVSCPLGWIDDGHVGCFLFAPEMAGLSWIEALEYCEEQVHLLTLNLE